MKQLESVKLVQFFLFEKEDIRLREITGIFGPNASGKSSLIDAIQVAMFGANGNLVNLNAQADERANSRTIKSYCLGVHDEKRARDVATTYITLVWRDTETMEPISMGVCIYASVDNDSYEVRGRYILPGVELAMHDHLEVVDNDERPRAWETFRLQLKGRAKVSGEDPLYADSERYMKAALHALRGTGGVPSLDAYKSAFRFALRMRFDKTIDQIVRTDILESRPTNIQRFKEVTDTFRRLSEKIDEIKRKIEDGEKVEKEFNKAAEAATQAFTWGGLQSIAQREVAALKKETAIENRQKAEDELANLNEEAISISNRIANAKRDEDHARSMRINYAGHDGNKLLQAEIEQQQRIQIEKSNHIRQGFLLATNTLKSAVDSEYLGAQSGSIRDVIEQLDESSHRQVELTADEISKVLKPVSNMANKSVTELFQTSGAIQRQVSDAKESLVRAKEAKKRVSEGRTRLSPDTERLMRELKDNGLDPVPVCDLVRITDPQWQPVIESYLGRNVEALLVEGAEHEAKAFSIYRGLTGPRAIYGAKVVAASRQADSSAVSGTVAELIEGDHPAAVSYLRRRFGDMMRAVSDKEAISGKRTMTQDGMLVQSGEYERLKPVDKHDFKIGGGDASQAEALKREGLELEARIKRLDREVESIRKLMEALMLLSESGLIVQMVESCNDMHHARELVSSLRQQMDDPEYDRLTEAEELAKKMVGQIQEESKQLERKIGSANTTLQQCIKAEEFAETGWLSAEEKARSATEKSEYDHDFASRQWDVLLDKFDDRYQEMASHCEKQMVAASTTSQRASTNGMSEFGTFKQKYREHGPMDGSGDWRKAREWIVALLMRLRGTELIEYEEQMNVAYQASQETFRTDVSIALSENLDQLDSSMERLNRVLKTCPVFSNGERYQFRRTVRPHLKPLLDFVKNVAAHGPKGDLFGDAGDMPEEFRQLMGDKIAPGTAGMQNPLDDYREFFDFDIEILREDPHTKKAETVGILSRRVKSGSGGEHRAPLYVIAGAALASAYRLDSKNIGGIRLMLLDEAFNKMDAANIIATMRYLEEIGLQVLMASPGDNLGTLTAFLHRYYDIIRDAETSTAMIAGHDVSEEMREMFRSDLPEFNNELLPAELAAMKAARGQSESRVSS
jgi:uncharacterized protein YPO0396